MKCRKCGMHWVPMMNLDIPEPRHKCPKCGDKDIFVYYLNPEQLKKDNL